MKFKKVMVIILIGLACCLSTACKTKTTDKNAGYTIGNYIIIKETHYVDPFMNAPTEYLVYDKNTKVMYTYTRTGHGLSICPYYVTDEKGNPSVGVFNERIN